VSRQIRPGRRQLQEPPKMRLRIKGIEQGCQPHCEYQQRSGRRKSRTALWPNHALRTEVAANVRCDKASSVLPTIWSEVD
jgi:hypothetical protein